ncbi:MAG TPA: family 43 glycosylhydrolase, partial [Streptomyces sp.]|nr:family 43 glycosylhydrolase [Streptomyces sp.]
GWQGAFRSRDVFGPYEERIVLAQGSTDVNGPHQGAWVRAADGSDWFLHVQQRGAYGRVVHLQPMRWDEEGWPVMGDDGEPVAVHARPAAAHPRAHPGAPAPAASPVVPDADDDFPGGRFGRQWSWLANPGPGWTTVHSDDGLWLDCRRTADAHDLRRLTNVLVQRLPGRPCTAEVELRLDSGEAGAKAGLAVLGDAFCWIGLERDASGVRLVHRFAESAAEHERDAARPRPAPDGRARLRVEILPGARCHFSARTGEDPAFQSSGPPFAATALAGAPHAGGQGRAGAQLGLFATAPPGGGPAGTAAFTGFRVT